MIEKTGIPPREMVKKEFPKDERVLINPKAIIECYKEIPCNPCETSCPFDAIHVGEDINKRPVIDFDKCTGCGICVFNCPGLAISVMQLKEDKALLKIPYEFIPRPKKDALVNVVNRSGEVITEGLVKRVQEGKKQKQTALLHIEIDRDFIYDAITIEVPHGQ